MLTNIILFLIGATTAVLGLWLRNKSKPDPIAAAEERIVTAEARDKKEREARLDEIRVRAETIVANADVTAALELLRRSFPGTSTTPPNKVHIAPIP